MIGLHSTASRLLSRVFSHLEAPSADADYKNLRSVLNTNCAKDPTDPTSKDDPALKKWLVFMDKYYPVTCGSHSSDSINQHKLLNNYFETTTTIVIINCIYALS
jgi:hypothetical protein